MKARILLLGALVYIVFAFFINSGSVLAKASTDFTELPVSQEQPNIRVGIWTNQSNILISADKDFSLISDTNQVLANFAAKDKVIITLKDGVFQANGNLLASSKTIKIAVHTDNGKENHLIEVNKRHYRGSIVLQPSLEKKGITVINTLPLEHYLYGIIAREISPEWPQEAVKAQAVAARTYALYSMYYATKHKHDGYDVCATTDCQVYGGYESEAPGALKAVDATNGQIAMYQGRPIQAFFHNNSGGYTENSENVWGSYLPYLRGVIDYDQNTPRYKWEKRFTVNEITEYLKLAGYQIGSLQAIELSQLTKQPVAAPDRGISGRVLSLRFIGSAGSIQIAGNKLRSMLTLDSTLFDIIMEIQTQKSLEFQITDSAGDRENKKVEMNLPPLQERNLLTDKPNIRRITEKPNETIVISGYGWGHGLGMSQWGAKVLAEKSSDTSGEYYKTILKHYYQGITFQKLY